MVKVRATSKGYVGNILREPGEVFEWPEGDKVGSWVKPVAFGGKGDHDGDGLTGGSVATEGDHDGDGEGGEKPKTGKVGKKAKAETVKAPTAEPFAEPPEPVAVAGNGIQAALGGVQPDWLPPEGDGKPVMAED